MNTITALGILGLNPSGPVPPQSEINAAWRRAAALHHPDRGGDPESFMLAKQAYGHLKQVAPEDTATKCSACGGTGIKREFDKGLYKLKIKCATCRGTGNG